MTSIAEVLKRLEEIIAWAKDNDSQLGYFAALYYKMTQAVDQGINTGHFEDGPRMARLDVTFAQRYFDAFDAWQAGQKPSDAWALAFEATQKNDYTVLQHLLMGINAHINLDLGIAAAQTCPGAGISQLETDFNRINDVIASLVNKVQDSLSLICPPFWIFDRALRTEDEGIANFSIKIARNAAWSSARRLAPLPDPSSGPEVAQIDQKITRLGRLLLFPGRWIAFFLWLVRKLETGSVRQKIDALMRI